MGGEGAGLFWPVSRGMPLAERRCACEPPSDVRRSQGRGHVGNGRTLGASSSHGLLSFLPERTRRVFPHGRGLQGLCLKKQDCWRWREGVLYRTATCYKCALYGWPRFARVSTAFGQSCWQMCRRWGMPLRAQGPCCGPAQCLGSTTVAASADVNFDFSR